MGLLLRSTSLRGSTEGKGVEVAACDSEGGRNGAVVYSKAIMPNITYYCSI